MSTLEKQSLIKGSFEPDDAKELLSNLFRNKINYHTISAFGINIRTGQESPRDRTRIEELKYSLDYLINIIEAAKRDNMQLVINCDVKIKLKSKSNKT